MLGDSLMNRTFLFLSFFIIFLLTFTPSIGALKKVEDWQIDEEIYTHFIDLKSMLEPTLSPPELIPEPDYSLGIKNTIYWSSDEVRLICGDTLELILFEVQAVWDDIELYGPVDVDIDSATFTNKPDGLPEGIPIEYRLRYYARNNDGHYFLSYWSNPEISIQDAKEPVLLSWNILHLQYSDGMNWVIGPTLINHVVASDSVLGKVMQIVIHEKSTSFDDTFYYDLDYPIVRVDSLFPYTMWSNEKEPTSLSLWVVDVAGQISNKMTIPFFWWPLDSPDGEVISFPNPFNPHQEERSIIKVSGPGITKGRIFDPFGNLIKTLLKDESDIFFEWDGRNERGDIVANGGYIFAVDGKRSLYCKIAILK